MGQPELIGYRAGMSEEKVDLEAAYATYDGFLKAAIKTYWDKGGDRVSEFSLRVKQVAKQKKPAEAGA